jgi:hypothetical protein
MHSLRAVEPNGLLIHDADGVSQSLSGGVDGRGHEPGKEGVGLVGHDVLDRYAGVVKCGLDDGVVLVVD